MSKDKKIDFTDENIIELLKKFNKEIYEKNLEVQNRKEYKYNFVKEKFEFIHYLKNKYYSKLIKHKIIFYILKKTYVTLRKIYYYFKYERNISKKYLKDMYINQNNEIEYLKHKITELENKK